MPDMFNHATDFHPGDRVVCNGRGPGDARYKGLRGEFVEYTPTHHYADVHFDGQEYGENKLRRLLHPESLDLEEPDAQRKAEQFARALSRLCAKHGVSIAPCCGATGEWLRVMDTNVLFDVDRIDEHGTPHRLEWGVTTGGSR